MNDNTDMLWRRRQAMYDRHLAHAKMCDSWALAFGLSACAAALPVTAELTLSGVLIVAALGTGYLQLQDTARTYKRYATIEWLGYDRIAPIKGPNFWQRALYYVPIACLIGAILAAAKGL